MLANILLAKDEPMQKSMCKDCKGNLQGRPEVGGVGVPHPPLWWKPSVILRLVGKSLHINNSVSVFRGSLKLKLSFRIDIVVGLFCFNKDFNILTLPLNLYVMTDYLQSIPSVTFSFHTPPTQKLFGTPLVTCFMNQKQCLERK